MFACVAVKLSTLKQIVLNGSAAFTTFTEHHFLKKWKYLSARIHSEVNIWLGADLDVFSYLKEGDSHVIVVALFLNVLQCVPVALALEVVLQLLTIG